MLEEIATRRGQSIEEFLKPGFLIDAADIVDAELDRRLHNARSTEETDR